MKGVDALGPMLEPTTTTEGQPAKTKDGKAFDDVLAEVAKGPGKGKAAKGTSVDPQPRTVQNAKQGATAEGVEPKLQLAEGTEGSEVAEGSEVEEPKALVEPQTPQQDQAVLAQIATVVARIVAPPQQQVAQAPKPEVTATAETKATVPATPAPANDVAPQVDVKGFQDALSAFDLAPHDAQTLRPGEVPGEEGPRGPIGRALQALTGDGAPMRAAADKVMNAFRALSGRDQMPTVPAPAPSATMMNAPSLVPGPANAQAVSGAGVQGQITVGNTATPGSAQPELAQNPLAGTPLAPQARTVTGPDLPTLRPGAEPAPQPLAATAVKGQALQSTQGQPAQAQPSGPRVQLVQAPPAQGQPAQVPPTQAQPVQVPPMQGPPAQGQPAPVLPAQGQPVQGQPVQGQSVQGQPVQGQPVQGQPVQGPAMPRQAQVAQTGPLAPGQSVQTAPTQPEPGQPAQAQPASEQPAPAPPAPAQPAPAQPSVAQQPPPAPGQLPAQNLIAAQPANTNVQQQPVVVQVQQAVTEEGEPTGEQGKASDEPRVHGFSRGGWSGPAKSAYGGRSSEGGQGGSSDGGETARALRREEERATERVSDQNAPQFTLDPNARIQEPQQLAQPQQAPEARPQNVPQNVPVPAAPAQELPDIVFQGRPMDPTAATENASISLHHPDLGPIQLEVHREQGRVEVHAVIESQHAQAVLRANESGIRQGVQQAGMTFNALRVRLRGGEQSNDRSGQERRRRGNQRET